MENKIMNEMKKVEIKIEIEKRVERKNRESK